MKSRHIGLVTLMISVIVLLAIPLSRPRISGSSVWSRRCLLVRDGVILMALLLLVIRVTMELAIWLGL